MAEDVSVSLRRVDEANNWHLDSELESLVSYAVVLLDPWGCVLSWNAGAQKLSGYSAAEILGQNFCLFFTHEDCVHGRPKQYLSAAREAGRY